MDGTALPGCDDFVTDVSTLALIFGDRHA